MMTEREREKEKEERRDSGTAGETSRVVTEEKGRLCAREAKVWRCCQFHSFVRRPETRPTSWILPSRQTVIT